MSEKKPKRRKALRQPEAGVARWEEEGGARRAAGAVTRALADTELDILERLGAAVVMEWNELPTDVQRVLFRHASAIKEPYDPAQLKARIARFLHDHKDDAADS
jgi:hypothetical protein